VRPAAGDLSEYKFLTSPGAAIQCRLVSEPETELQLFGNRRGLLSFSNVLLWFLANAWRREFLSLGELDFVRLDDQLSVCIRITEEMELPSGSDGTLRLLDRGKSLDWAITEEGLQRVALLTHRLVSNPSHEYDRLLMAQDSACGVHVRMIDAVDWTT